jgi:Zn-finger nucleic acid-binding protein
MNCLGCGAATQLVGNHNHFRCDHCGNYSFPQETGDGVAVVGDTLGADCPVCQQALVAAAVEGETVCYCGQCRGFLTSIAGFGRVVEKRRALHGPNEQRPDPFDPAELKRALKCPNCTGRMDAHPYSGGGNAVVDTCERCRLIWLDAGELAVIERFIPHVHQIERTLTLPGATSSGSGEMLGAFFPGPTLGLSLLEDLFQ